MSNRSQSQSRLETIARTIEPKATVKYAFDEGAFIVSAPRRRDAPLAEDFVADRKDREIEEEIRRRWSAFRKE